MEDVVIEKVSLSDKTGNIILTLTQSEPWDDAGVLQSLLARIGGYISAFESGSIMELLPETAGRTAIIRLIFYTRPSDKATDWLASIQARLQERGIGLELLHVGY